MTLSSRGADVRVLGVVVAVLLSLLVPAVSSAAAGPTWVLKSTGTTAQFRGLSAIDGRVAWVSGSKGTVLRTVDGGTTWASVGPPDAAGLEFRDVQAFDAFNAVVLSIGNGDASRIYRTSDGGKSWTLAFRNTEEKAFYDCVAFFDRSRGLAMGDPVDGQFRVLSTSDGGRHWKASDTPLLSSQSAGVFAVAFRTPWQGIAVGGDYARPTEPVVGVALTSNRGTTWKVPPQAPGGYRSGVAWRGGSAIAVGPTGSDVSVDGGRHWRSFDTGSFDTVDCTWMRVCWASGAQGRVAVLRG